jgi:soluble lytic murein transglycosylase-like protein
MRNFLHSCRFALLSGVLLYTFLPNAVKADQIVISVDEQGRAIYVNTGDSLSSSAWSAIGTHTANGDVVSASAAAGINLLVDQTANRFQMDPELIRAMVQVESGYNPKAVSSKGALGLMQLIPATAARFGVTNPFDPKQNLEGGVTYLKHLMALFGGNLPLSLAAYNAGEQTVQRSGGIPAISQTQDYVRKITSIYKTGDVPAAPKTTTEAPAPPITRHVDANGVVHFSNVE